MRRGLMRWHWQKRWQIKGWHVMLTYGQAFAIGIHTGYGWTAMRINGFSILLGPFALDVHPPLPAWLNPDSGIKQGDKV